MIRNYFITALRNIIRNKIQSFIQVLSLAIGISATILIGLYAKHELSVDKFNKNYDRIYRLEYGDRVGGWTAPGHQIKQEMPEVENVVRMVNFIGKDDHELWPYYPGNDSTGRKMIYRAEDFFYCDSTVFEVFTFNLRKGDPRTALRDPNTCVLSQSTATTFFGDRDPVGETLGKFTVTGIFEDVKNSHIEINILISIVSIDPQYGYSRGDPEYLNNYFNDWSYFTYLLLPEGYNPSYIEKRVNELTAERLESTSGFSNYGGDRFSLRPLKEVYFTTNLKNERNYCRHGNLQLLRVLMTTAFFILLLAIINYVNLTTARASLRAREVGIRKVAGSSKAKLIILFLAEAILVTMISLLIALTMVQLLMPGFNKLASTDLDLEYLIRPGAWMVYFIAVIALGLVSGIYPAVYMTRYQPVISLAGEHVSGSGSVIFRRTLLTFQFAISVILIIGLFVIFRQLDYMKSADLGFNKDLIVNLEYGSLWGTDYSERQLFKQHLMQYPNIKGVAFSNGAMGGMQHHAPFEIEIEGISKNPAFQHIDPDFLDVMEIDLVEGRFFSWDRKGDFSDIDDTSGNVFKVLINETAVCEYELESPVGYFTKFLSGIQFEIIGVISDFNYKSQHIEIEPCIYPWYNWFTTANIKISPADIPATLRYIQKQFEAMYPEEFFEYSFLDETYAQQYLRDEKTAKIISIFAIVAVLIACLGLFGLSSFMAARRTKEIGIRKTMGASVQSVFLLLSREFIKWVVLSIIIACPLAWYIMNKWLQSFAYRTNISIWIFVLAILIAFAITFITVTWQSLKTARTNPVEALRYE